MNISKKQAVKIATDIMNEKLAQGNKEGADALSILIKDTSSDMLILGTPDGTLSAKVNNAEEYPSIMVMLDSDLVAAVEYDGSVKKENGSIMTEAYAKNCDEMLYKINFETGSNDI